MVIDHRGQWLLRLGLLVVLAGLCALATAPRARASIVPTGFRDKTILSGLTEPTAVAFAPDGRVFVAERSGVIKVFPSIDDPRATVVADLRTQVYNGGVDRGMLGLAVDPDFTQNHHIYVLYSYDAPIGGTAPLWGSPGATSDPCPPGEHTGGCVVSGRLSQLTLSGDTAVGSEHVLINDWCYQFGHTVGQLQFGADGDLYASGGDGASFSFADYGQSGQTTNACGDPPSGVGGSETPPTAEGGALRAQDLRTPGDPTSLDGTLIRVDPSTGDGAPDNPLASSADANARRIVAYGFRNPFRFAVRPGTNDIWVGNVGWNTYEAIDRVADPTGAAAPYNFGWPCYEGSSSPGVPARTGPYDTLNLNICEDEYSSVPSPVTPAYYSYQHGQPVVSGEDCGDGSYSDITGLAFTPPAGSFPASYDGALFFADVNRGCIWVMKAGMNGLPDPSQISVFAHDSSSPVWATDIEPGPDHALYYADVYGGGVHRITYAPGAPIAKVTADVTKGQLPLTVHLDGTGSTNPDGTGALSYSWDLNGDGVFGDSTSATPTYVFDTNQAGPHTVRLRVTNSPQALSDTSSIVIDAGNTAPTAAITTPDPDLHWNAGDQIQLVGHGTDAEEGALPPSALSWQVLLERCPGGTPPCSMDPVNGFGGPQGTITAPEHGDFSRLLIELTATDSGGLSNTATMALDPVGGNGGGSNCSGNPPPISTLQWVKPHRHRVTIRGSASDLDCAGSVPLLQSGDVASVGVYLARMAGGRCRFLQRARFGHRHACADPPLMAAAGTQSWRRTIKVGLVPGHYLAGSLATDEHGAAETPGPANQTRFRVRAAG